MQQTHILVHNGIQTNTVYFVPNSKCTPFNYLFHVHHCDSSVLSHCVPQNGATALMLASLSGHTDVVQLLLSSWPQVDLKDEVRRNINLTAMSLCSADTMFLSLVEENF